MIYPDASVLVALFAAEPASETIAAIFDGSGPFVVSDYAVGEVSSAVARTVRTGERTDKIGKEILAAFDDWVDAGADPIDCLSSDIRKATALVRRLDLPLKLPDALHLAICQRVGARLFTLDKQMIAAARAIGLPLTSSPDMAA